jgi:hypothetical protein
MKKIFLPLKPSTNEVEIIAFDTEDNSRGAPDNFICASFYSAKEQVNFFDRDKAREYMLLKRRDPVVFFAHNLGYDLANLDYPEGSVKQIVAGSKLIGGLYKYNNKVCRFMDTGNFFCGASIKSLGKLVGDYKLEFDISRIKNKDPESLDYETKTDAATYCMKDAEICYKISQKLFDLTRKHQTRFKAFTAGSLSLRMYRTKHMNQEWSCRDQTINNYERTAYYGGRTEVFDYNKFDSVYYEDINSSYPTAMYYHDLPKPWSFNLVNKPRWEDIKDYHGISLVTVKVPKMNIPPLPYKHPKSGKLIFPFGTWTGSYVNKELVMAEKYGCEILKVHSAITYGESFNPFKDYIETFHKLKSNSTGIEKDFYKMLMNSLSGKLGEKRHTSIRIHQSDLIICSCYGSRFKDGRCLNCSGYSLGGQQAIPDSQGWISLRGNRLPDPAHSFPCLIAYITAAGRIKLYEDRLKYQDIIYCDTDSSVSPNDHSLNRGNELGMWDMKKPYNFKAYAPKFYEMDYMKEEKLYLVNKLKGVPKNHMFYYKCNNGHLITHPECIGKCVIRHFENSNFCATCGIALLDKNKSFRYERPIKLSEGIHRNKKPNLWELTDKVVSLIDDKRFRLPDGTSEPLYIQDNDVNNFNELVKKYEML